MSQPAFMPMQSAPIDRTPAGAAAFAENAGVEAAAWWDDVFNVVKTVGPPLISALGSAGI